MRKIIQANKRKLKRVYTTVKTKFFVTPSRSKPTRRVSVSSKNLEKQEKRLYILTYLASFTLVGMVVGALILIIIFAVVSRQLPNPNQLLERSYELSTKIFDKNKVPIYEVYGEKNRTLAQIDEISPHVQHATIAVEDAAFYSHRGYSIRGMVRALRNTLTGKGLQGGSTLTQQVIKNTLLSQERTISRKLKELILSLQLENKYTKAQILQMYLNEAPYGGQNYGIYTASKTYFNKEPKDLSLAESAYLAGLPQRPSFYSQFGTNPEAGIARKNTVLQLMYEKGWEGEDGNTYFISEEEYEDAKATELVFQSSSIPFKAPHFIFYVKQKLVELFGEEFVEQGGLQVQTTLDLELQDEFQKIVYEEIADSELYDVYNGGLIAINPNNGYITAMVGSKGYFLESQPEDCISGTTGENSCWFEPELNTTTSLRQPGSTIKPITYATMLNQGYSPAFMFLDVPTKFPGQYVDKPYVPVNYDGIFRGPMSLRKSLANSLNIPAVKALKIAGIDNMIDFAEDLGINSFKDRARYGLALTLGGGETQLLELTGAFSAFANEGKFYEPTPIIEVRNSKGDILYNWRDDGGKKVMGEDVAFLISDILSDDGARSATFGLGSLLKIPGYNVAVKTGTTDDKRDNYAIGYTPSLVIGTWVGNNNNERMNPYIASGITGATPIWSRAMTYYLNENFYEEESREKFEPPSNVEKFAVDELTGMLPYDDKDSRYEWFIKGTEPSSVSDWYTSLEVCKEDNKIANGSCKDADRSKTKTFIDIQAELPEWQLYVDKWISENYSDDDQYFPPKMQTCLSFEDDGDVKDDNKICAEIVNFNSGDRVPLDFRLSVEVSASNDVERVNIYKDGEKMTEDNSAPFGFNFELGPGDIGQHTFSASAKDKDGNKDDAEVVLEVVGYQLD